MPAAAPPATVTRDTAVLDELMDLGMDLARAFKAKAAAALQADDLDRAVAAAAGFNRTALGIRRAIALKARLDGQREEGRHRAESRRQRRQEAIDDRRRAVADGLSHAIAVVKPGVSEARERLTADLWGRLTEGDRIDADLADTALPVETLILRLGRAIGLSPRAIAYGLDPTVMKARADQAAAVATPWGPKPRDPKPWDEVPAAVPEWPPAPPPGLYKLGYYRMVPAADLGLPGDGHHVVNTTTGEVYSLDGNKIIRQLPMDDRPPERPPGPGDTGPGDTGPPTATAPPDPAPDPARQQAEAEAAEAERKRLESERNALWRNGQLMAHILRHG
ncbi:hypothetical protein [Inquilinus sp.]|uniref:hypothetical protein n=1 Tax=Inquilinus sp. TaxID=1932117 RepID=UPI003785208C